MDENSDLVKILKDATGETEFSKITVGRLKELETNNVKLSTVLDPATSAEIYEILLSGYVVEAGEEKPTAETLTIGGLSKFSVEGVELSSVLGDETAAGVELVKILKDCSGKSEYSKITVGDLKGLNTGKIKLSSVISPAENEKIFDILVEGAAFTGNKNDFTVSDIKNFNSGNIKLSSVIDPVVNKNVFDILADGVTGYEGNATDIKVGDIKGFNVSKVKLKTVIPSSDNKILSVLLADESVTVGNAGDKINALKVSDIYGDAKCFVENAAGTGKYYKLVGTGTETFVLTSEYNRVVDGEREAGKTYDISTSSGVWFFMFYAHNSGERDTNGYGKKYTATDISFGEMESKVKEVSQSVQKATIRELVSCGLVGDPGFEEVELYRMTLRDIFDKVKAIP